MVGRQIMAEFMAIDIVELTRKNPGTTRVATNRSQADIATGVLLRQHIHPAVILAQIHTTRLGGCLSGCRPAREVAGAGAEIIDSIRAMNVTVKRDCPEGRFLIEVVYRATLGIRK